MDGITDSIVKYRKTIIVFFIILVLICGILSLFVDVNYNLVDYLPKEAQSTMALEIMKEEFDESLPNASVMVKNVSLMEAVEYKEKIASIDGITQVIWLDDMMDITQPLAMGDADTIESFYKDGNALFSISIAKGKEKDACEDIYKLIGEENAIAGEAVDLVGIRDEAETTVVRAFLILLPIIILILLLTTSSWLEPLLFLLSIGVAVIINMGTSIFLGEVSFITNSISPILQLACSLDYAVFLLHSFQANRKKYASAEEAMARAVKESIPTVAASAATTLFGFLALLFMSFGIGADLGLVLAKGIVLSFISVMVFLPAITLGMTKLIDKTRHREFLSGTKNIGKVLLKIAVPMTIIILIIIVPAFLGQSRTEFLYGNDVLDTASRYSRDRLMIEESFGQSTAIAILVPKGDIAREQQLHEELNEVDHVTGVVSFAGETGAVIPPEFPDEDITKQFYSENYARIIAYADTGSEGDIAFQTVENIHEKAEALYGDGFYTLGRSTNLYDMKKLTEKDNLAVNLIAVAAIFLVLLVTFKSVVLPFILVLAIETGIWINLSIPYFTGTPINFLGYLVLSTIQLGATVDYAILLTNTYLANRKLMPKYEAMKVSLGTAFKSILVSALILSTAGFTLYLTSSNRYTADIGLLLGRGTLLSLTMVVCFLPILLFVFDRAIQRTTYRAEFY